MNKIDLFIIESGTRLFGSSFEPVWLILIVILSIWSAFDAKKRGKSWLLVMIMIYALNSLGFLLWLIFRSEKIQE